MQPCSAEEDFQSGKTSTGCNQMWSHGYDTFRVQHKCHKCVDELAIRQFRFGVVKDQLKVLKEHLELIKGQPATNDDDAKHNKQDAQSEEQDTSLTEATDDGDDTLVYQDSVSESMEEVRVDPKHRPFRLPQVVIARRLAIAA